MHRGQAKGQRIKFYMDGNAITERYTDKVPPSWGPEEQHRWSLREYSRALLEWNTITSLAEDRRATIAVAQLTGALKASVDEWLADPRHAAKRLKRLQEGNRAYRIQQMYNKFVEKAEQALERQAGQRPPALHEHEKMDPTYMYSQKQSQRKQSYVILSPPYLRTSYDND